MTICFGKVIALSPFRVQIDQKLVLTKEFFIVKNGVSASSFKVGDVLILFRNEGLAVKRIGQGVSGIVWI